MLKAISNEKIVKLLGVTVDNKLSFEPHLNLVCKKVSQKLCALARVSKFISKEKLRVIMKLFIMSFVILSLMSFIILPLMSFIILSFGMDMP